MLYMYYTSYLKYISYIFYILAIYFPDIYYTIVCLLYIYYEFAVY